MHIAQLYLKSYSYFLLAYEIILKTKGKWTIEIEKNNK